MTTLTATTVSTPVGPLSLVAADDVLVVSGFAAMHELHGLERFGAEPVVRSDLGPVSAAIRRYFDGELDALDEIPVEQPGGPFRQAAWKAMRAIPAGETITYRDLAERAGSPDAVRAAGSACARNAVAPVVPCHRVVRTGGSLGGYGFGLTAKEWLLAHERRSA